MKARYLIVIAIACLLVTALLFTVFFLGSPAENTYLDVYVGIDVAYDSPEEIKTLVDSVSPYTNFFVIGSTGITYNETKLDDICQYVYDKGLSFILYTDAHDPPHLPSREWIETSKARWGNNFMGLYVFDEVGGKHLDLYQLRIVDKADNNTDARNQYVSHVGYLINQTISNATDIEGIKTFSSDYALYWFDYKAGYNTLFAQFGGNYSREINVALCRGAAIAQNKDWGVMITHAFTEAIESGEKIYADMVLAYENGAKYIVIFDSNMNYTHGTLTEEHLHALKQFTEYAHKNPRTSEPTSERTAFVLPKDFGYGFRGPTDRIWGLWNADAFSYNMSSQLGNLLQQYGYKLDIIYDDEVDFSILGYSKLIFWNGTVLNG